jgi:hypothetical protein
VRHAQADVRCDIRDLITDNARILSLIGNTIKAEARDEPGATP